MRLSTEALPRRARRAQRGEARAARSSTLFGPSAERALRCSLLRGRFEREAAEEEPVPTDHNMFPCDLLSHRAAHGLSAAVPEASFETLVIDLGDLRRGASLSLPQTAAPPRWPAAALYCHEKRSRPLQVRRARG